MLADKTGRENKWNILQEELTVLRTGVVESM